MALREKILELRTSGMTYNQIAKTIPCAKSTVSYYCGKDVKNNTLKYQEERRAQNPLIKKMENFRYKFSNKSRDFQRRNGSKLKAKMEKQFTAKELENFIKKDPTCYLTGRKLDISKPETYSLDHFVPASKGGKNTLDNLRLVCREANSAKHDMLYEEFIQLCREVVQRYDGKK